MEKKEAINKRVKYLDIIKLISIMLVVFCHTPLLKSNSILDNISMLICWGAVPCFFMTTGAIYLNKSWNFKKYIKKVFIIYLTICIWKIIYLIFYHCLGKVDILKESKSGIFNYIFLFRGIKGITDGHFWFMYAYLSIFIVYPIFQLAFNNNEEYRHLIAFITILVFVFSILPQTINIIFEKLEINNIAINNIKNINPFGNYSYMLLYFLLGGFLYKYNIYERYSKKKIKIRIISVCMIIIGVVGLLLIKKYQFNTFVWKWKYLKDGYKWISTLVMSLGIFISLQNIEPKNKIVNKIIDIAGGNTIGIFYLHVLILEFLQYFTIKYKGTLVNAIKVLIVVAICSVITSVIKRIPIMKKIVQ